MSIYTLEDLRNAAPAELKDVSDEQLVVEYAKDAGMDPFEVADYLGVSTGRDTNPIFAGISSGTDTLQGLGYSALAAGTRALGADEMSESLMRGAEGQQYEGYLAGRPEYERIEDLEGIGDYLGYGAYQIGKQLPIMGGIAAAGLATGGVGTAAGLSARTAMALGSGGTSYGVGVGSLYQSAYEAEQQGQEMNLGEVFAKALPYAAAEAFVPVVGTSLIRGGAAGLTSASRVGRGLTAGGTAAVTEGATELLQTELEISMNPYLSEEEKYSQRLNAAVAGGVSGGALGTAGGLLSRQKQVEQKPEGFRPTPTQQDEIDLGRIPVLEGDMQDELGTPDTGLAEPISLAETTPTEQVIDENQLDLDFDAEPFVEPTPEEQRQQSIDAEIAPVIEEQRAGIESSKGLPARGVLEGKLGVAKSKLATLNRTMQPLIQLKGRPQEKAKLKELGEQKKVLQAEVAEIESQISIVDNKKTFSKNKKTLERAYRKVQRGVAVEDLRDDERVAILSASPTLASEFNVVESTDTATEVDVEDTSLSDVVEQVEVNNRDKKEEVVEAVEQAERSNTAEAVEDEVEQRVSNMAIDELFSEVSSEGEKAEGRATIKPNVIAGVLRALRRPNPDTTVNLYDGNKVDTEADPADVQQAQAIYDAVQKVLFNAYKKLNAAPNILKTAEEYVDPQGNVDFDNVEADRKQSTREDNTRREADYNRQLNVAIDELVQAAGSETNAQAVIAAFKKKREAASKNELLETELTNPIDETDNRLTAYESVLGKAKKFASMGKFYEHIDTLLSSSFANRRDSRTIADTPDTVSGRKIRNLQKLEGSSAVAKRLAKLVGGDMNKSPTAVLSLIEEVAPNQGGVASGYQRILAKSLKRVFRAMTAAKVGQNLKFKFAEEGQNPSYDPATHTVTLTETASPEQVLHELLHAGLQWYVGSNPNMQLVNNIEELLDKVIEFDVSELDITDGQKQEILDVRNVLARLKEEGSRDDTKRQAAVLELISYGLTLNSFKHMMKYIDGSGSKPAESFFSALSELWQNIIKLVRSMVNKFSDTEIEYSAAEALVENSFLLLDQSAKTINKEQFEATRSNPRLNMGAYDETVNNDAADIDPAGVAQGDINIREHNRADLDSGLFYSLVKATGYFKLIDKSKGKMSEVADAIRKDHPTLQRGLSYIAAGFSATKSFISLVEQLKVDRHSPQYIANELAAIIRMRSPEEVLAIIKYLDGDSKSLEGVKNPEKVRIYADLLLENYERLKQYVPKDVADAFSSDKKFSEILMYIDKSDDVASQGLSGRSISDLVRSTGEMVSAEDIESNTDLTNIGPDGKVDPNAVFIKVRVSPAGSPPYTMMVDRDIYRQLDGALPVNGTVNIESSVSYKVSPKDTKKNAYRFRASVSYKDAVTAAEAERYAFAIQNTLAALSHNYSVDKFMQAAFADGLESGYVLRNEVELRAQEEKINAERTNPKEGKRKKKPVTLKILGERDAQGETTEDKARDIAKISDLSRSSYYYVRVPEGYGELSGMLVHGPEWNFLSDAMDRSKLLAGSNFGSDVGRAISETNRLFKIAKTRYSAGTQVTNVASNVSIMNMHGISFKTLIETTSILYRFMTNAASLKPNERLLVQQFINSGALSGNFSTTEVAQQSLEALKDSYDNDVDTSIFNQIKGLLKFQNALLSNAVKAGERVDDVLAEAYAFGDNMFRFAAFTKSIADEMEATNTNEITEDMVVTGAKVARNDFLNYDIDAPLIKGLRQSVVPFISWSYAVIPVMGRILATKPHRVVKLIAAYAFLDAVMSALAGDDEERRKAGSEDLDKRLFPFGPHASIRIPFLGETEEDAVYYKLGDYMVPFSANRALPNPFLGLDWWPSPIQPSGPLISAVLFGLGGVDPFTGKGIHSPTDTTSDKFINATSKIIDTMLPPSVNIKTAQDLASVMGGKYDVIGREESRLHFLMAKVFGLKVVESNDLEEAKWRQIRDSKVARDYKYAMSKLKREYLATGDTDYDSFSEQIADLTERLEEERRKIWKIEDE